MQNIFPQYCRIILKAPQKQIRYLDLFSGPGVYQDGSFSTPLLIAKSCANDQNLSQKVQLIFNDNQYSEELANNFHQHYSAGDFKFPPRFHDRTVGEDERITNYLKEIHKPPNPHPTVLFMDPWGYKGIDTRVLGKFLQNWGNEIFLFVNIKRIRPAIENPKFDVLMKSLFPTSFSTIKNEHRYKGTVHERLSLIMDNLATEFKNAVEANLFHCAFKFQEEDSNTTSHFIIHFTKHEKGYELVKQIYYDFDNIGAELAADGNYTFDAKQMDETDSTFNFGDQNIQELSKSLILKFSGHSIAARKLFTEHQPTTKYCGSHYAKTLRHMVTEGSIESRFTDNLNHQVSVILTDKCILDFP